MKIDPIQYGPYMIILHHGPWGENKFSNSIRLSIMKFETNKGYITFSKVYGGSIVKKSAQINYIIKKQSLFIRCLMKSEAVNQS
jgi:hypothetical protein